MQGNDHDDASKKLNQIRKDKSMVNEKGVESIGLTIYEIMETEEQK